MNRITDRRKLHGASGGFEDDIHQRGNTSLGLPPSLEEMRKISKELETLLKEERTKRIEVEENFRSYQERIMTREKEFYSILEENHKQVRAYKSLENGESSKQIKQTYEELFTNFESANEATTELIEKKYKENLHTMERRIENIMEVFGEEIGKSKKVSNENFEQIKNEVERALTLVKSIESENVTLRMNLKEEKYKTKLMNEERKLLLDEMVNKKFIMTKILNENKKLKTENEKLKALQIASQENSEIRASRVLSKASENEKHITKPNEKKRRFFSNTFTKEESEGLIENVVAVGVKTEAFLNEESIGPFQRPAKSRLNSSHSYEHSQVPYREGKIAMKSNPSSLHNVKNQIKFSNGSKKYSQNFFNKSLSRNSFNEKNCMLTNGAPFQEKYEDDKATNCNEKTIQHLKQCLEREKKKVYELGKIITKIQNRNQEVNETIIQMLSESKDKNKSLGAKDLESIMKSEKILYLISDMKKRLQMCEKPTIQCGWEDTDINSLLESFDDAPRSKLGNEKPIFSSTKSDIFVEN